MTDEQTPHIADDQELMERFVLGTLDPDDRLAVERHVSSCDACAAAVGREQLIAAGAKRLGRDELKSIMRRAGAQEHGRALSWPRILSAAAVVGALVGAGLYSGWFESQEANVADMAKPSSESHAANKTLAGKLEPPSTTAAPLSKQEEQPAPADARSRKERFADDAPAATGEKKSPRVDESAARRAEGEAAATQPSAAVAPAGVARDKGRVASEVAEPTAVFWTEGTPLRGGEELGGAVAANKVDAESRTLRKESDVKSKTADRLRAAGNEAQQLFNNYRITQRPASALPPEQQIVQQKNLGKGVPTKVAQAKDMTTLTLFLDSLVSPAEVDNANVESVSDDSVVVNLGNQKIGYRFPQGANKQQRKQLK